MTVLTPNQAEQLLALLERHCLDKASGRDADELSFGSLDVLAILQRLDLVASFGPGPTLDRLRLWWLTAAGQQQAREILQERIHG